MTTIFPAVRVCWDELPVLLAGVFFCVCMTGMREDKPISGVMSS